MRALAKPGVGGCEEPMPAAVSKGCIFFQAQPADHAPCATTNVAPDVLLSARTLSPAEPKASVVRNVRRFMQWTSVLRRSEITCLRSRFARIGP